MKGCQDYVNLSAMNEVERFDEVDYDAVDEAMAEIGVQFQPPENKESLSAREVLRHRALAMYLKNYSMQTICTELGIHGATLRRWMKDMGMPPRRKAYKLREVKELQKVDIDEAIEKNLVEATDDAIKLAKLEARLKEDEEILGLAESQSTPGDKYQHYIAATAIQLMRDSMKNIRGPRNIKELSELDQLIRRNLGLNNKNNTPSRMHIDISILNNPNADRGGGSIAAQVRRRKTTTIDVDPESGNPIPTRDSSSDDVDDDTDLDDDDLDLD